MAAKNRHINWEVHKKGFDILHNRTDKESITFFMC